MRTPGAEDQAAPFWNVFHWCQPDAMHPPPSNGPVREVFATQTCRLAQPGGKTQAGCRLLIQVGTQGFIRKQPLKYPTMCILDSLVSLDTISEYAEQWLSCGVAASEMDAFPTHRPPLLEG